MVRSSGSSGAGAITYRSAAADPGQYPNAFLEFEIVVTNSRKVMMSLLDDTRGLGS
jgi:hypothetical protein